ncbi:hypothetical protein REC12_22720 [Desulfosporosinus sp. PR]|nr:hypothetical protein [Desulfosporosinus sp. PR]
MKIFKQPGFRYICKADISSYNDVSNFYANELISAKTQQQGFRCNLSAQDFTKAANLQEEKSLPSDSRRI